MFKNSNFLSLLILIFISCQNPDKTNSSPSDKSEDAFAKIDKKYESSFTSEDRRNAYNKNLSSIEKTRNSLKNNVTYNGYGSNAAPKKTSLVESNAKSEKQPDKKSIYNYSAQSNSQIYSAYSTN